MNTLSANSSLAYTGNPGALYTSGATFIQANLSHSSHVLTVDNQHDAGQLGFDYVEVVSITGGSQ
jgi:hypothetical protein